MSLEALAWAGLTLAALPLGLTLVNLGLYRGPRRPANGPGPAPAVSVVVPARDEEEAIGDLLATVLAQREVALEVVVVDDASTDGTADVVRAAAARDPRVRLVPAPDLPAGWNGKQHACAVGARAAAHDLILFLDADVRLTAPDALARLAEERRRRRAGLLSGVPRQVTGSWLEHAVIPLIHFVLLGYLPLPLARLSRSPAFAAGCGQLVLVERAAYDRAGGHAAIRGSRHDGLQLPRAVRASGGVSELVDVAGLARCRMYRGARSTWLGLLKNAHEGMASPAAIGPWSVLLLGGHVLPFVLLAATPWAAPGALAPLLGAAAASLGARLLQAGRFRLSLAGVLLHPVGVGALVAIQWHALLRRLAGRETAWKGRTEHAAA